MSLIIKNNCQQIIKNSLSFFKADTVLLQVSRCFGLVPLKLHSQIIADHSSTQYGKASHRHPEEVVLLKSVYVEFHTATQPTRSAIALLQFLVVSIQHLAHLKHALIENTRALIENTGAFKENIATFKENARTLIKNVVPLKENRGTLIENTGAFKENVKMLIENGAISIGNKQRLIMRSRSLQSHLHTIQTRIDKV
jgi:hypothetical protein